MKYLCSLVIVEIICSEVMVDINDKKGGDDSYNDWGDWCSINCHDNDS